MKKIKRVVLGEGKLLVEDDCIFKLVPKDEEPEYGYHWKRRYTKDTVRLVAEILPRASRRKPVRGK